MLIYGFQLTRMTIAQSYFPKIWKNSQNSCKNSTTCSTNLNLVFNRLYLEILSAITISGNTNQIAIVIGYKAATMITEEN